MEVTLSHDEVDQRAQELARLWPERKRMKAAHAEAKSSMDKELKALEKRMDELAGAVTNSREERKGMPLFDIERPPAPEGDPADHLADAAADEYAGEVPPAPDDDVVALPETIAESIARDRAASGIADAELHQAEELV